MKRIVWIEFIQGSGDDFPNLDAMTFTNVESLHMNDDFVIVDYTKGDDLQSNYYPISRIARIHETIKGIRKS